MRLRWFPCPCCSALGFISVTPAESGRLIDGVANRCGVCRGLAGWWWRIDGGGSVP